jgi:phosphoribosylanthranilate isomerase
MTTYPCEAMTKVKICGITRPADAEAAVAHGAWAIGLNHWERSSRRVDPAVAAEIGQSLKRQAEMVGVFVNPTLEEVVDAVENAELTMVQLHGEEGPAFCSEVARRTGTKVIKAFNVRSSADVRAAEAYRTDYHLLDGFQRDAPGGTGKVFDWEFARNRDSKIPLILAGGLTPENVADAISITHPFAIDVASGVESEPGVKDLDLMRALFEAVPGAVSAEA